MSSITKQRVGKHTYLYESVSYWDADKKRPDNNKVGIGKIDNLSGKPVYTQEYLDKLAAQGISIIGMALWDKRRSTQESTAHNCATKDEIAESVIDTVKDFGVTYFLRELSEKIGLLNILRETIPNYWQEVFCLACYLLVADKPVMYCEEWVEANAGFNVGSMSSQRISDLFAAFGCAGRNSFYQAWHKLIREREYIALDITSISSYSKQIAACEWGYNRDGDDLPQVNICMLFGETSKMPVFQTIYNGSLSDVSTLKTTLSEFTGLTGDSDIMTVMDKGFFSAKNVNMLLGKDENGQMCRFLMPVPFTSKFAKSQVESERKDIDAIGNVILTNGAPIRGIHKLRAWSGGRMIHTHVFFDPEKAVKERNELFGYVTSLARQANADPYNEKLEHEYKRYLIVRKSQQTDSGVTVSIREDVIAKELETVGWFILVSNHIDSTQAAHDIYRMKDVVEKGFLKYKSNLGLDRLRVHGDIRMQNKIFVAFIALIIASAIHGTMKDKQLFKSMTFDKLIFTLAKLKSATVSGRNILRPLTKEQKTIFKDFDISPPDYDTLKPSIPKKRDRKPKGEKPKA